MRLKQGVIPWRKPWRSIPDPVRLPTNFVTKKAYQGFNILNLQLAAQLHGYPAGLWASYNQWRSVGAQVRKGEKATYDHPLQARHEGREGRGRRGRQDEDLPDPENLERVQHRPGRWRDRREVPGHDGPDRHPLRERGSCRIRPGRGRNRRRHSLRRQQGRLSPASGRLHHRAARGAVPRLSGVRRDGAS